jgi:hypothetical protein
MSTFSNTILATDDAGMHVSKNIQSSCLIFPPDNDMSMIWNKILATDPDVHVRKNIHGSNAIFF